MLLYTVLFKFSDITFQCTEQWFDILQNLAAHPKPDIQHRGVHTIMNLISADKDIAARLIESTMLEV